MRLKKTSRKTNTSTRIPSERNEQIWYMTWAFSVPVIRELIFHIPNERRCSVQQGFLLKRMGVRAGVSDIFLPLKTVHYSGLWIELKTKTGIRRQNQIDWINKMRKQGFMAEFAVGWVEAKAITERFLADYESEK